MCTDRRGRTSWSRKCLPINREWHQITNASEWNILIKCDINN